jgi:cytochrome c-type biogenesis protein
VATLDSISPALALLAGFVSFISPCVLPLVPAYLAYLGAKAGRDSQVSVIAAGLAFVLGLSFIFILFFYVFSLAVQPVRAYVPVVAGVLVLLMAAHVAGLIHIPLLDREYRVMDRAPAVGGAGHAGNIAGGFVLGMGFAGGWTPCIGITLSAVLTSAVSIGTTAQGLALIVAYCVGLGLPFIILAFALDRTRPLIRVLNGHRRAIELLSAAVLVAMGVLLLTNRLAILSAGITQLVPNWPSPTL